jgi:hypothetical protein
MKSDGEVQIKLHAFITSILEEAEWCHFPAALHLERELQYPLSETGRFQQVSTTGCQRENSLLLLEIKYRSPST